MEKKSQFIITRYCPSEEIFRGKKPVINMAAVKRYVLEKRPSLSQRKWHIEF